MNTKTPVLVTLSGVLLLSSAAARADVEISSKPTANMSCDAGVCTATAQKAVLNVSDLANMLASGDVAVKTGLVAKDIDVDQPLTWSSTARLTLDAQQSVTVKKQVTVAGQGALTVTTNDTGGAKAKTKTGEFIIVPEHGSVQFWDLGSSLTIDGNSYTLVGDIKTLASDIAAKPSGFYALAKPYDATVDGTYTKAPITTQFKGVFEGLANSVSHLSISAREFNPYGLFAFIETEGTILDLALVQANIDASGFTAVGLLAGGNEGRINRCRVSGKVNFAGENAGGLAGVSTGEIDNSVADVHLSGSAGLGGGLVGYNTGFIRSSYALGSVALRNSDQAYAAGLAGENQGIIQNSFSRNRVKNGRNNGSSYFGGLIGKNDSGAQAQSVYAAGAISPFPSSGGLVGFDAAKAGSISNTYWDLDDGVGDPAKGAANVENDPGITGLTTAQFQSGLPAGFDPKIWAEDQKTNGGFPYLTALPPK